MRLKHILTMGGVQAVKPPALWTPLHADMPTMKMRSWMQSNYPEYQHYSIGGYTNLQTMEKLRQLTLAHPDGAESIFEEPESVFPSEELLAKVMLVLG